MAPSLFGNGSDTVHWQPNPTTRGTFDILSSCVITLLLCVWSAVHVNVPRLNAPWEHVLTRVGFLVTALLAPELVAFTAWYQRRIAKEIVQKANFSFGYEPPRSWRSRSLLAGRGSSHDKEEASVPEAPSPFVWTMTHGYFASMGGLALEIPRGLPPELEYRPPEARRQEVWTLEPKAVLALLDDPNNRQDLPKLTREQIDDRSKASGLVKTLTCIQAIWFCLQCITRLAQGLPISLLELNTFGHSVCALLIFLLWWDKPFDVAQPFLIVPNRKLLAMAALRRMATASTDASRSIQALQIGTHFESSAAPAWPAVEIEMLDIKRDNYESGVEVEKAQDVPAEAIDLPPGSHIPGTCFQIVDFNATTMVSVRVDTQIRTIFSRTLATKLRGESVRQDRQGSVASVRLEAHDLLRYRLAWELIREQGDRSFNLRSLLKLLSRSRTNVPVTSATNNKRLVESGVLGLAGAIYGGLHAVAWNAHFTTSAQQLLWRISACVVIGSIEVSLAIFWALNQLDDVFRLSGTVHEATWIMIFLSITLLMLAYVLARMYLVVECFFNLGSLPSEVFILPTWSTYIPHIS